MMAARLAALLLAASLGGCSGGAVTQGQQLAASNAGVARAVTDSTRAIEIHGAPPDGAAPEAVAAAIPATGFSGDRRFRLVAPGEESARIVLEFGESFGGGRSCAAPSGSQTSGGMLLSATLCRDDVAFSNATLRAADIAGPSDPGFGAAAANLIAVLLKPAPPKVGRNDR